MSKTDDTELIERCRSGDREAFQAFLLEYEKTVLNAAYRMLNSRDDAQDVTQTVFLKVFENIDKFDPSRRFFSWIYRITLNESINWLGKTNRLEPLTREAAFEGKGPEQELESARVSSNVQAALMTIKSDDMTGRAKIYESIVKGDPATSAGIPESFNVLVQELRGLALDVRIFDSKGKQLPFTERDEELLNRQGGRF